MKERRILPRVVPEGEAQLRATSASIYLKREAGKQHKVSLLYMQRKAVQWRGSFSGPLCQLQVPRAKQCRRASHIWRAGQVRMAVTVVTGNA
jgi:hypothetical protein